MTMTKKLLRTITDPGLTDVLDSLSRFNEEVELWDKDPLIVISINPTTARFEAVILVESYIGMKTNAHPDSG
jgi:hypothetical protein